MTQAAYTQDTRSDPAQDLAAGQSEIASFYSGRNVLLTGGTGFFGRLLIERILRSCPEVNTLFLIVREKKGKSPEERFTELFNDVIFDRLKKEYPEFSRKVMLVEGDMARLGLGLSLEQRELLKSSHIVIHAAATVRFDEKLRIAASINVRGTQELVSFAKEMTNLKAFVYISTAFSNCVTSVIEEKLYPPPIVSDKLLSLIDILDDACLDHLTPVLLGKWPNTYTFTKAVAEDIIRRNCPSLPLCIVRPSIVVATSKEPVAGWINNFYGATGIVIGAALGLLRTVHCYEELVVDMIPADYVISNIVAAAWDTGKIQSEIAGGSMVSRVKEPPTIYNVVSSTQRPITWKKAIDYNVEVGPAFPSMMCLWYHCFTYNRYRWVHNLYTIFLHLIPAAIVDSLAWLTGRKPMLWAAYKKIHKFSSVIEYFTLQQWKFDNKNVQRLWEVLSPVDRNNFDLDIGNLDWKDYFYRQYSGLRVYLVKDPLDTLPQARARYTNIMVNHAGCAKKGGILARLCILFLYYVYCSQGMTRNSISFYFIGLGGFLINIKVLHVISLMLKVAHYTLVTVLWGILLWLLWLVLRFVGLW